MALFFVRLFSFFALTGSILCCAQSPFIGDFLPPSSLGGGTDTWGVAVGDFNGDNKVDLATTNPAESKVSIFTGNGDGTFTAGASYQVTAGLNNPLCVATADVNGDGKLDLIVTSFNFVNPNGGTISVLMGNGDGTFQSEVDYAAGVHPTTVVVKDFSGDGKPDLAVTDNASATILVFINNGDGTFQPAQAYAVGTGPYSVATGDFNGDGKADLAVTNYCNVAIAFSGENPSAFACTAGPGGNTLSVLLGNGDGTFQPQSIVTVGTAPYQIVAADLNLDGKADLILTDGSVLTGPNTDNTMIVLLSNGDGTFQPPATYVSATFGPPYFFIPGNTFLVVADFNGDGKLDVLDDITEFLGNGDGTFQAGIVYPNNLLPETPGPQAVSDLNGDGHLDVISGGTDDSVTLNAASATRFPTTTALSVISDCQQSVTITVLSSSGPAPTGGVTLQADGQLVYFLGQPGSMGAVVGATNLVLPGTHTISAAYSGDLFTQGSMGSATVSLLISDSATTIMSDHNPSITGQSGNIVSVVTDYCAANPTGGSVTFLDGTTPLETVQLTGSEHTARLPLSVLTAGTHSITASYSGSVYLKPSVSPVLIQVVNGANLGLGVAPGGSNTATVQAGATATYQLAIGGAGETGNATLSCSGAPVGVTCSVPATVGVGNRVSLFSATVTTTARSSSALQSSPIRMSNTWFLALGILGILVVPSSGHRRSKRISAHLKRIGLMSCLLLLMPFSGCGGGGSNVDNGGAGSTPAGTYTLTVTAKLGSAGSQSVPLTLIVQ
jgi:hypothetical protein